MGRQNFKMANILRIFALTIHLLPFVWTLDNERRSANFDFSQYYQNHMVLQRADNGTSIWGHSVKIGDVVHIKLNDHDVAQTTVNAHNIWIAKFPSPQNGNGPYNITAISSLGQIYLNDVLFGDVWVCSGQSNMEFFVRDLVNATEEFSDAASYQHIRIFRVGHIYSNVTQDDIQKIDMGWSIPSAKTIPYFSAVCWLYGKYLSQHLNYPIGLVESNWGGTRIEAWSSSDAIQSCPASARKRDKDSVSELYNGMIHPLLRNTIKGVVWYQGESNAGKFVKYSCQFPALIKDWRQKFHTSSLGTSSANFPFGFVQLAPYRQQEVTFPIPNFRWAQTENYGYVPNPKMQNVFMAVAMDLPDFTSPRGQIHPRYKHDIARRLVLSALAVAYHQKGIEFQGPFPSSYSYDSTQYTLSIEYDHGRTPIEVRNNTGFDICCITHGQVCSDRSSVWKAVHMKSHSTSGVVLDTSSCTHGHTIGGVRYAWRESPCSLRLCAIYGRDNNLPAPIFKHLENM